MSQADDKFSVKQILQQFLQSIKKSNQTQSESQARTSKQAEQLNSNQSSIQWDHIFFSMENIQDMKPQKAMAQLLKIASKFESIFQQIKLNFKILPNILKQSILQILERQPDNNQLSYTKLLEKTVFQLVEQQKRQAQLLNQFINSFFLNYQTILARQTAHINQVFFPKQGFKFQIPSSNKTKSEHVFQIQQIQRQTVTKKLEVNLDEIYKVQLIQSSKLLSTSHVKKTIYFKLCIHQIQMFDGIQKTIFLLTNTNKNQIVLETRQKNKRLTIVSEKEFSNSEKIYNISNSPIISAKQNFVLSKAFEQKNLQLEIADIYSMEVLKM